MYVELALSILLLGSIESFTVPNAIDGMRQRGHAMLYDSLNKIESTDALVSTTEIVPLFKMREADNSDTRIVNIYLNELRDFHSGLIGYDSKHKPAAPLIKIGTTLQSLMPQVRNCHVVLVYLSKGVSNTEPIGLASYNLKYECFGPPLMHMEHLFVKPSLRCQGAGLALMNELARVGKQRQCSHIEWNVQKENVRGLQFYNRIGANVMDCDSHGPMDPCTQLDMHDRSSIEISSTMKWIPLSWNV